MHPHYITPFLSKGLPDAGGHAGVLFELSDLFSCPSPLTPVLQPLCLPALPSPRQTFTLAAVLIMRALPLISVDCFLSSSNSIFSIFFSTKCVFIDFRDGERKTLISWGSKSATQTCGPIGNQAGGLLVHWTMLSPLRHPGQGFVVCSFVSFRSLTAQGPSQLDFPQHDIEK